MSGASSIQTITFLDLVAIETKFICHVNSRNHVIEGICGFVVGHNSDRSPESEFKTFFICHVTLCDHVINRSCDLIDNKRALEPTTLSSLIVIGLAEVEI